MSSTLIYLLLGIFVGGSLIFLLLRFVGGSKTKEEQTNSDQGFILLQNQLDALMKTVDSKLGQSQSAVQEHFKQSQELLRATNREMTEHLVQVTKAVTETNEGSKQVFGIAEQLKNLEKVLTSQKQRGNLGEASLELILSNILPPSSYKMQYEFTTGEKVDAVIFSPEGLIPIDAKFSLENYNRAANEADPARKEEFEKEFKKDLKRRIDETAKYIIPEENTLPFAFMFIPAEGIYYDLLIHEVGSVRVNTRDLIDYAYKDKNVVIVSPTTFSAYLQSVLYGFRAFKIEGQAKQIGKRVEELSKHLKAYEDYFNRLGNSLGTTVSHYNNARRELGKIDKDVVRITGNSAEFDLVSAEKPEKEEV